MYEVLKMDWPTIQDSNLLFRSNSRMRTLEFNGSDIDDCYSNESSIIIVYNIVSAVPLLLVERIAGNIEIEDLEEIKKSIPKSFNIHIDHNMTKDGEVTDIVLVRRELYVSLSEEDN